MSFIASNVAELLLRPLAFVKSLSVHKKNDEKRNQTHEIPIWKQ